MYYVKFESGPGSLAIVRKETGLHVTTKLADVIQTEEGYRAVTRCPLAEDEMLVVEAMMGEFCRASIV